MGAGVRPGARWCLSERRLSPALGIPKLLREFEMSPLHRAILQLDDELMARSSPCFIALPHVDVLIGGRIILQAASAGGHRLLDGVQSRRRAAGFRGRAGGRCEDVE